MLTGNDRNRQRTLLKWAIIVALIAVAVLVPLAWVLSNSRDNTGSASDRYATGTTPIEAVQNWVEQVNETHASSFKHLQTRDYLDYSVILYELPSYSDEMLWYQRVKGSDDNWYIDDVTDGSGGFLVDTAGGSPPYIRWTTGKLIGPTIFFGRAVSDEVAAVEFEMRDGQTVRASVIDGLFVVVCGTSWQEEAVRALDADGEVLSERVFVRI